MNRLGLSRLSASFAALLMIVVQHAISQSSERHAASKRTLGVEIQASAEEIVLRLPLKHPAEKAMSARLRMKLLDPEDLVRAESAADVSLVLGQKDLVFKLTKPFAQVSPGEMKELHYLRLQYEARTTDGQLLAAGIEALRTPDTAQFSMTAAASWVAEEGRGYLVRVHARASDGKPLAGVRVHGELSWDEDRGGQKLPATMVTDAAGNCTLRFAIPSAVHAESGDLTVEATRGLVTRSLDQHLRFRTGGYLLLDTDKDIYQPGQTLHSRVLAFDSQRKSRKNQTLDLRITDEDDTLVLRQALTTDAFGVAHLDWAIPASVLLGDYQIQVAADTDEDSNRSTTKSVHVYRYDLPNFRVTAKPDRPYYLPAQNAEVKVSAEYLFGKPVTRGEVRVVEEEKRTWNFRQQEWEVEAGQVQSGELDRDGRFTARFDMASYHADLHERTYTRFKDINLAAYVTDLSTGRTEQQRFSLRVTNDAIHVYVSGAGIRSASLLPTYYVSTFYADGTPARCKVRLSSFDENDKAGKKHFLSAIETNKYGLAKVSQIKIPSSDDDDNSVLFDASEAKGFNGRTVERIYRSELGEVEVTASHAIHKPGEPIEVFIRSTKSNPRLIVEAVREGAVLATQRATLRNGRAYVVFPYEPRFVDEITVAAYSLDEETTPTSYLEGAVTVLYPKDRRLEVAVRPDKDEHRPGDDAKLQFAVRLPDQSAAESSLGVKIVDVAVEERARTDRDFGQRQPWDWWFWSLWCSNRNSGFGGVSRDDLDHIDLSQPVSADLDLVAEFILRSGFYEGLDLLHVEADRSVQQAFSNLVGRQLHDLELGVGDWIAQGKLPRNNAELAALGKERGLDVLHVKDPWGTPYRYELSFVGSSFLLNAISAGPDKQFGSADDVAWSTARPFFSHWGKLMETASKTLMEKKGLFIRDRETLQAEMLKQGVDFNSLRDPWNLPYETRFVVSGSFYVTQVVSHGQDTASNAGGSVIWQDRVDYFTEARTRINLALTAHLQAGGAYPATEREFKDALRHGGVDLDELRDPWGSPYFLVLRDAAQYADRVTIRQSGVSGERATEPVTLVRKDVLLMSAGEDQRAGTADDFQVASYSTLVSSQGAKDETPSPARPGVVLTANTGAITGTVKDPQGAVIAGANVQITRDGSGEQYSTTTGGDGTFLLKNLQPGSYAVGVSARGFRAERLTAVVVQSMQLTEITLSLGIGATTETVEVMGAPEPVQTSSTALATKSLGAMPPGVFVAVKARAMSTPRVRQDFPETMLWEPALVTDRRGRAQLNFKFADNITTWKLTAVASTRNGELGYVEKDLRAFQPFFVEHDPPRILTEGDEIAYPLVLRNYLDRRQTLKAWIDPAPWFALLGPAEVPVKVEAGDSGRAVFRYRAVAAIINGRQKVSAANAEISDAAVKPVDVHPFGRPDSVTTADVMDKNDTLVVHVPDDAIAGSLKGRLKIYPNLMAHVVENLEAGLEKPHGCGEQTISSTYPSLLVTEIYANSTDKPAIALKAQRYLADGYERLLSYQEQTGGFSYWGHGDPDLALTAYAVEFLSHAARYTEVDDGIVKKAEQWILGQQGADGAWRSRWDRHDDKDALLQTAYIVQTLASAAEEDLKKQRNAATVKALAFLAAHRDLMDEPFVIASYALAAHTAGDEKAFAGLVETLRKGAHHENNAAYWVLERNTPFFAWGRTGRLESTALALRVLVASGSPADRELIHQGLLFLLRNEDKDGMWYSGQTTVHILKTLLSMVAARKQDAEATMRVRVNGKVAATVALPKGQTVVAPLDVDVSPFVIPGENRAELETSSDGMMSVQFRGESYVPWNSAEASKVAPRADASSVLKLAVTYSSNQVAVGDVVECRVRAERLGYRGYGMMLGEIGLPPGSDVDRESLERAKTDYSLFRYDVLPDRVIVYLWPRAGGSQFNFRFRARFAMKAETAPSVLYDYYNPDALVNVQPVRFDVAPGRDEP